MTARYRVLPDQVDAFRRELGVKRAVRVHVRNLSHYGGRYVGIRRRRHSISIRTGCPVNLASQVLRHEIAHALQAERLGGPKEFDAEWMRQFKATGLSLRQRWRGAAWWAAYDSMPLEAEAIDVAERFSNWQLTTVRR